MTEILHVAFRSQWFGSDGADAVAAAPYPVSGRGLTVADEGYVHCATRAQLAGVLERHYADVDPAELTVLVLDTALIEADGVEVRFEDTHGAGEDFPHVYAELRPSWVTRTEPVPAT
ncbi:DUF952 domain-containing protein [Demequina activiva]|uniref:DUF952 domain-containing protein n=1 Tax=Demequina activiva TaxID=1582364 RepID=A0A919Q094_9MICO|nr:DUF952 domain-containing protein [Demequina activiva]GIG53581.1 hypothetical protein Dac01nite_03330 [Demequina activiva]